jgi:uncharacterized metal-binding protein
MAECCGAPKRKGAPSCCGGGAKKTVLLYACSGGANVAEIADRAARALMAEGRGSMFCLAGLGADIPAMVQTARDADLNLVIDGCPMGCAKKIFDRHGITACVQVRVTDLGIEKQKGVRASDDQVARTIEAARAAIAKALMA